MEEKTLLQLSKSGKSSSVYRIDKYNIKLLSIHTVCMSNSLNLCTYLGNWYRVTGNIKQVRKVRLGHVTND